MKHYWLAGSALLLFGSGLALAQPESLLPDIFDNPPPEEPTPAPAPSSSAAPVVRPTQPVAPQPGEDLLPPSVTSDPVIQQIPGAPVQVVLPEDFPTLEELEEMEDYEINELFGLRPKFDVPPGARRALARIGVIARDEGGFPSQSLAGQPAALVRAALEKNRGPMVSRWGHILLRRVLASRMDAPDGMDAVEFAALRASLLDHMGEFHVARMLVQDVDSGNYSPHLVAAAFDSYLGSGDLLGICPVARSQPTALEGAEWIMTQAICDAYLGETRGSERRLDRALGTGEAPEIDVRLAQRYAGAAGIGATGVTIEWDGVDELTPWRFSLARMLGEPLPEALRSGAVRQFDLADALIPAVSLPERVAAADYAAQRGVMSSSAMVDLYSQLYASEVVAAGDRVPGQILREAYVAENPAARLAAMRQLWGTEGGYGPRVLTAYAAARMPVSEAFLDDAADLIGSMLAAGLDRNARQWGTLVPEGSEAWGLLVLAQEQRNGSVSSGALDTFVDDDESADSRKSKFLLAGLAGLGRVDSGTIADFSNRLEVNLTRESVWSQRISQAAEYRNAALVALLAGVGMQGDSWSQMTARQLYFIVRSLDQAGLNAEARMIAAEAVARA